MAIAGMTRYGPKHHLQKSVRERHKIEKWWLTAIPICWICLVVKGSPGLAENLERGIGTTSGIEIQNAPLHPGIRGTI
jgi:hypothetical protein